MVWSPLIAGLRDATLTLFPIAKPWSTSVNTVAVPEPA